MARTKNHSNGHLEEALADLARSNERLKQSQLEMEESSRALQRAQAHLVEIQAAFLQQQTIFQAEWAKGRREDAERFARIEKILLDHSRILAEHTRILEALPEAVRQKIGFKPS